MNKFTAEELRFAMLKAQSKVLMNEQNRVDDAFNNNNKIKNKESESIEMFKALDNIKNIALLTEFMQEIENELK